MDSSINVFDNAAVYEVVQNWIMESHNYISKKCKRSGYSNISIDCSFINNFKYYRLSGSNNIYALNHNNRFSHLLQNDRSQEHLYFNTFCQVPSWKIFSTCDKHFKEYGNEHFISEVGYFGKNDINMPINNQCSSSSGNVLMNSVGEEDVYYAMDPIAYQWHEILFMSIALNHDSPASLWYWKVVQYVEEYQHRYLAASNYYKEILTEFPDGLGRKMGVRRFAFQNKILGMIGEYTNAYVGWVQDSSFVFRNQMLGIASEYENESVINLMLSNCNDLDSSLLNEVLVDEIFGDEYIHTLNQNDVPTVGSLNNTFNVRVNSNEDHRCLWFDPIDGDVFLDTVYSPLNKEVSMTMPKTLREKNFGDALFVLFKCTEADWRASECAITKSPTSIVSFAPNKNAIYFSKSTPGLNGGAINHIYSKNFNSGKDSCISCSALGGGNIEYADVEPNSNGDQVYFINGLTD